MSIFNCPDHPDYEPLNEPVPGCLHCQQRYEAELARQREWDVKEYGEYDAGMLPPDPRIPPDPEERWKDEGGGLI